MNLSRLLPAIFSFFLATSGCISLKPTEPDGWSLGLDTSDIAKFPPGEFWEGQENVTRLGNQLNETIPAMLRACGQEKSLGEVQTELARSNLLFAIWLAVDECQGDWIAKSDELEKAASSTDERLELFLSTRAQARHALQKEAAVLDGVRPGSVVDAEVLAVLMDLNSWHQATIETAEWAYNNFNETGNPLDWSAVFTNLLAPILTVDHTRFFVEYFPWTPGECIAPDTSQLEAELAAKLAYVLDTARVLAPPRPGEPLHELYGSTLKGTKPDFEYYAAHDWWPGLLNIAGSLSLKSAVLDTYSSDGLPSREEAQYLFAKYRHFNRSLATEWWSVDYQESIRGSIPLKGYEDYETPWEERHEYEARQALALQHREVAFSQLQCSGPAAAEPIQNMA